jgi:hypothetical protein
MGVKLGLSHYGRRIFRPKREEVEGGAWSYTSTPPYVFMAWCLIKQWIRLLGVVFG